jgi:hypothetical protein
MASRCNDRREKIDNVLAFVGGLWYNTFELKRRISSFVGIRKDDPLMSCYS